MQASVLGPASVDVVCGGYSDFNCLRCLLHYAGHITEEPLQLKWKKQQRLIWDSLS